MAYNSRHKKLLKLADFHTNDDEYVYPTKKIREMKTRSRKHDANLIKAGLADHENREFDAFIEEDENDDDFYDPNFADYEIEELIEKFGDTDSSNQDTTDNSYEDAFFYDYNYNYEYEDR